VAVGLTEPIIADIKQSLAHPDRLPYFQITPNRRPTLKRKFQQLSESGVVLLVGTDSGIPMKFHSQSTWHELDAWVNQLGVDPMAAIRAATYWPSVADEGRQSSWHCHRRQVCDIIAVRGDILRYVDLLQNVGMVIKHGTRYK
jgi:imidazolonepropionase-like amidohydrolase